MPEGSIIDRILAVRNRAEGAGDKSEVARIDAELAQVGYAPHASPEALRLVEERLEATAHPADQPTARRA